MKAWRAMLLGFAFIFSAHDAFAFSVEEGVGGLLVLILLFFLILAVVRFAKSHGGGKGAGEASHGPPYLSSLKGIPGYLVKAAKWMAGKLANLPLAIIGPIINRISQIFRRRRGPTGRTDYSALLDQTEQFLNDYDAEFVQYKIFGNDILQTHHDHMHGGGYHGAVHPPVSNVQWANYQNSNSRLQQIHLQVYSLLNTIVSDRNFPNIDPVQRVRLGTLAAKRVTQITDTQNYQVSFQVKYSNADPP